MELSYIVGAGIGAGAVLLGVVLTGRRDNRVRTEERRVAERAELRQALRSYLAAIDALTAMMPEDPPPKPPLTPLDQRLLKIARGTGLELLAFIINRILQRAMYGNRPHQLLDRLADASAHLRLIAPPTVAQFMIEGEHLANKYAPHDEQWLADWREFRKHMRSGFREALDHLD
ncbi:MAG TPA: hypothetical protein VNV42_04425 [Solirubrobacteraceae bacterium]|jgi:hypothetical protein|nr:hypothetical protein [Solirubrobacteraceae bacterium]